MKQLLKAPKLQQEGSINDIDIRDYKKEQTQQSPAQSQNPKNSVQLLLKSKLIQEADDFLRTSKLFTKDMNQFTEDEIKDIMQRKFEREKLRKELRPDISSQTPGQYLLDKYVHFVIGAEQELEQHYIEEQKRKEEEKKIQLSANRNAAIDEKVASKRMCRMQTDKLSNLGTRKITKMLQELDSLSDIANTNESFSQASNNESPNEDIITINDRRPSKTLSQKKKSMANMTSKINNMQLRKITPQLQCLRQSKTKQSEKLNIKGNEQQKNQYGKQLRHQRFQQLSLQLETQFQKVMQLSYVQRPGNSQETLFDLLLMRPFGEFQRLYIPDPFRQNLLNLQQIAEGLLGCCEHPDLVQKRINEMYAQIVVQLQ